MREGSVLCPSSAGFHRMDYYEWGAPSAPVLLCVHGLTRTGRDFDYFAAAMSDRYRVVCPDVAGRGRSEWLADPSLYTNRKYVDDMAVLIASLGVDVVDWLGTSMGGLIGMLTAALPNHPIKRLIINDVGPHIPQAALARIADYVGIEFRFKDMWQAGRHVREAYAPFGRLSDSQWDHLTTHSVRDHEDGGLALCYDPEIAVPFKPVEAVDMWDVWDAISCPVLAIRGGESDVLLAETAEEMRGRGPEAELIEFADCGHAPPLMAGDQIHAVRDWLEGKYDHHS
ncbi:MAG: alpha/beta hydrolase [Rhodospirillaceae bacterium]|nr:alpha/beta hydrolase [Rhodospirillaceae bacterium]